MYNSIKIGNIIVGEEWDSMYTLSIKEVSRNIKRTETERVIDYSMSNRADVINQSHMTAKKNI